MKSYLDTSGDFCGVDLAYNKCSCISDLFLLSDYTLQTMNWANGSAPLSKTWTISNSVSTALTNFTVKTCGDYKLSPVTTSINGYIPVSIVTDGFLVSGAAKDTITLTGSNVIGNFKVLV
jgi:hypothetical protein